MLILKYLNLESGKYIDIGAGHPKSGSNTYLFYKLGWTGTTIDPIKKMNLLHQIVRPRDKQILGVVSDKKGYQKFFEYNPTEYSTVSISHNDDLLSKGFVPRRSYEVETFSLNDLFENEPEQSIDLLTIDTEGHDYEVLKQLRSVKQLPRVICVETMRNKSESYLLLKELDYELVEETGNNAILVHKQHLAELSQ